MNMGPDEINYSDHEELKYILDKHKSAFASMLFGFMDMSVGAWMMIPSFETVPPPLPKIFVGPWQEPLWGFILFTIGMLRWMSAKRSWHRVRRWTDFMATCFWTICTVQFIQIAWTGIATPMTACLALKDGVTYVMNARKKL
jgi:hypothetical protein